VTRPTPTLAEPITIAEFWKNRRGESIRLVLSQFQRPAMIGLSIPAPLRLGDAVRLGRPRVKNGIATIRTEKTGQVVVIPILPPLQASIEAGPIGELTFIASKNRRPMTKESFGNRFREACKEAPVPGSAHGLRKAGATRERTSCGWRE
jgi:integrase